MSSNATIHTSTGSPAGTNPQPKAATSRWAGRVLLAKGIWYQLLSTALLAVTGYAILVAVARVTGPAVFGTYVLASTILVWIESMTADGYGHLLLHAAARGDEKRLRSVRHRQFLVSVLLTGAILGFAMWLQSYTGNPESPLALFLIVAAVDVIPFTLYSRHINLLTAHKRYRERWYASSVYALVKAIGVVVILQLPLDHSLLFLGVALGSFAGYRCCRKLLRKTPYSFAETTEAIDSHAEPRKRGALLLVLGTGLLLAGDIWALEYASNDAVFIGAYGAALSVVKVLHLGAAALLPLLATELSQAKSWSVALRRPGAALVALCLLGGLLGGSAIFSLRPQWFTELLFGSQFAEGNQILVQLAPAYLFLVSGIVLWSLQFFLEKSPRAGYVLAAAGVLLPLVSYGVIQFGGTTAAPFGPMGVGVVLVLSFFAGSLKDYLKRRAGKSASAGAVS